jgi:hypothetical protein
MIEKLKKLLQQLKLWATTKVWPWLKKNWMVIVNYLVIFISYSIIYNKGVEVAETLLGLWIFVSLAYAGYKYLFLKK